MKDDNGGFRWANKEQMARWSGAYRPEGPRWTGSVHRSTCSMLGRRGGTVIELTESQLHPAPTGQAPQTGKCCGGDGRPFVTAVCPPVANAVDRMKVHERGSSDSPELATGHLAGNDCLHQLASPDRLPLGTLLSQAVPKTTGIYALWHEDELLYVGISVMDPKATTNPKAAGVQGRLRTYLDGWLTTDFTVAVALRFVVSRFDQEQLRAMFDGRLKPADIRPMVKQWIAANIDFTTAAADGPTARVTEAIARKTGIPPFGKPSFNGLDP